MTSVLEVWEVGQYCLQRDVFQSSTIRLRGQWEQEKRELLIKILGQRGNLGLFVQLRILTLLFVEGEIIFPLRTH